MNFDPCPKNRPMDASRYFSQNCREKKTRSVGIATAKSDFVIHACIIFYFVTSFGFILSLMQSARLATPVFSQSLVSQSSESNS